MSKVIIQKLSPEEKVARNIRNWPVWEKEKSVFEWEYDNDEECYVIEGEVEVQTPEGSYKIGKGDFVTFRKGLKCTWNIGLDIRKHYRFP